LNPRLPALCASRRRSLAAYLFDGTAGAGIERR
jgi:hypothetical protein